MTITDMNELYRLLRSYQQRYFLKHTPSDVDAVIKRVAMQMLSLRLQGKSSDTNDDMLDTRAAAKYIRHSRWWLSRHANRKKYGLPAYIIGGRVVFKKQELDVFFVRCRESILN